ncbi:MAG: hypothetical protein R3B09_32555 [Nannocystaceae bacterium]
MTASSARRCAALLVAAALAITAREAEAAPNFGVRMAPALSLAPTAAEASPDAETIEGPSEPATEGPAEPATEWPAEDLEAAPVDPTPPATDPYDVENPLSPRSAAVRRPVDEPPDGRRMITAGATLTAIGVPMIGVSVILFTAFPGDDTGATLISGFGLALLGAHMIGAGVPILAVGVHRKRKWSRWAETHRLSLAPGAAPTGPSPAA